jgi:hypothetical protein
MPDIFVAQPKAESVIPEEPYTLEKQDEVEKPSPTSPLIIPRNTVHLFSSFCQNPDGISFQSQEEGEKILLFLRKDFITNLKWILLGILLVIAPLFILLAGKFIITIFFSIPFTDILFFLSFYYLVIATYVYINFITWYYNVALITDRRVIDVDFSSLVYKDVATTKLSLVQDVSYAQVGVVRTFFDYGNILIQTAGSLDNFTFESSSKPEEVVHIVEELIGRRNE